MEGLCDVMHFDKGKASCASGMDAVIDSGSVADRSPLIQALCIIHLSVALSSEAQIFDELLSPSSQSGAAP